ncbi:hypothetical protein [Pseudoxanthomonas composti]|uniref:Uncharacterized protein n=1 Tax=Pseudoxanthomonas composti TaxID=2137479 RepID=A0A4Q1JSN2_9GAMM|nr:hypothetical protein [Pseudoxanthomonas composti]RXQ99910.1 hypothetical protein EPA99_17450 [Pseudoxanthomonas composti]
MFDEIDRARARIRIGWEAEGGWTPGFRHCLISNCLRESQHLHPLDASELRYRVGELLVELGAIRGAQLGAIDAFLTRN